MSGRDLVAVDEQVQLKALKNYYERWEDKSEICTYVYYFNTGLTKRGISIRGDLRDVRGIEIQILIVFFFEKNAQILCNFV